MSLTLLFFGKWTGHCKAALKYLSDVRDALEGKHHAFVLAPMEHYAKTILKVAQRIGDVLGKLLRFLNSCAQVTRTLKRMLPAFVYCYESALKEYRGVWKNNMIRQDWWRALQLQLFGIGQVGDHAFYIQKLPSSRRQPFFIA